MAEPPSGSDDVTKVVPDAPAGDTPEVRTGPSRYELLEPLGRGGGGVVYAAHDRELDRRVAVKLLRAGAGGSSNETGSQARLVREAQAMARLAHPNVIPVYDVAPYEVGEMTVAWPELVEDDEVPAERGVFVVMELVEGNTMSEWLQQGRHPWKDVLAVMVPAGRGLAAAHAQGLVHRDFKPGNVLIGDDGRPRVLDFGLARASEQPWSESSSGQATDAAASTSTGALTQTGTVLGTPVYMAPEQHRGEAATEAADQYSYCVVLHEALCGRRPFSGTNLRELRRQKEAGAVPRPPADVRVPGWLWAVVERGLAPDVGRRFPSMNALLHALDVAPRVRRRRALLAGVSAVVIAGVGIGMSGWLGRGAGMCADRAVELDAIWNDAARAQMASAFAATQKPYAQVTLESATQSLDAYAARWTELRQHVCRQTHVEHMQSIEVLAWRDECLDGARDALQELTRRFREADAKTVERAVEAVSRLPAVDRCGSAEVAEAELARGQQERARVARLEGGLVRARALLTMAEYDAAAQRANEVLAEAQRENLGGMAARARVELGRIAIGDGDSKRAESELRAALATAEEAGDEEAATHAGVHLTRATGVLLGRHDEADRMAEQVAARMRRRGREDELAAEFQRTMGSLRDRQGRFDDALAAFERALELRERLFPPGDPAIAQALGAIGLAQFRRGQYEAADQALQRAIDMYRKALGESHPLVGKMLMRIAVNAATRGRPRVAIAAQREALGILEGALAPTHPDVMNAMSNLAVMLHNVGDDEGALALGKRALALEAEVNGKQHPEYGKKLGNVALTLRALDRREEAIAALREQLALFEHVYPKGHVNVGYAHLNLASVLADVDELAEAQPHAERALEVWTRELGPKHDYVITALSVLAGVELELGHRDRARELSERGLKLYDELEDFEDPGLLGEVAFTLARSLPASRRSVAVEHALRAREALARAPKSEDELVQVETWLEERGVELPPLASRKPPPG